MQVCKSGGKNIFQSLKNRSFLEKIGALEYVLKIGLTSKKLEYLAAMRSIHFIMQFNNQEKVHFAFQIKIRK